jgi:hypothetical protein
LITEPTAAIATFTALSVRDPSPELQELFCRQTPAARAYHNMVLFEERLYLLGGKRADKEFRADAWYRGESANLCVCVLGGGTEEGVWLLVVSSCCLHFSAAAYLLLTNYLSALSSYLLRVAVAVAATACRLEASQSAVRNHSRRQRSVPLVPFRCRQRYRVISSKTVYLFLCYHLILCAQIYFIAGAYFEYRVWDPNKYIELRPWTSGAYCNTSVFNEELLIICVCCSISIFLTATCNPGCHSDA